MQRVKYWLIAKYDGLMIFLGLHIDPCWLLLKAIEKEINSETAKTCYTLSVILGIKFGNKNNRETIKKIREFTESND